MKTVAIELPDDVLDEIGEEYARTLAREALLVKLYDLGQISGERAIEALGISRESFVDVLDGYGVSAFDESEPE